MRHTPSVLVIVAALSCSSPRSSDTPKPPADRPALAAGTVREFTPIAESLPATRAAAHKPSAPVGAGLDGLRIQLSDASQTTSPPSNTIRATSMSMAAATKLLSRLPGIPARTADKQAVALRKGPKPPSRGQLTTSNGFVAGPGAPSNTAANALSVLRYAPEGAVDRIGGVSVTFSHPMRALSAHTKVTAKDVPVRVSPAFAGKWRWVDTRTVILEPANKLPRATRYRLEVPAGTTAATGQRLSKAVQWTFETPPPKVTTRQPSYGPQSQDPTLIVGFDQQIDPAVVLGTMELRAGTQSFPLALLTKDDLVKRGVREGRYKYLAKGTWLAAHSTQTLPVNTKFEVVVKRGTKSAEGPLVTAKDQVFSFRTFGPLKLERHQCTGPCDPQSRFSLTFSNGITAESAKKHIRVTPRLQNQKISASGGEWVSITGDKRVGRTYRITVGANLEDKFGNRLGKRESFTYKINPRRWYGSTLKGEAHVVVDPASRPTYDFLSIKHKTLDVKVYAVAPTDHHAFVSYLSDFYRGRRGSHNYYFGFRRSLPTTAAPPGKLVVKKTLRIRRPNELTVNSVDLRRAMPRGLGHAIVVVEATKPLPRQRQKVALLAWVQSTKIGLSAMSDRDAALVMASDLATGAPQAGVKVSLLSAPGHMAVTGNNGLAELPSSPKPDGEFLVATRGKDTAILPWRGKRMWAGRPGVPRLLWYVFEDRGLYRPGEQVHIKGWLRSLARVKAGDVQLSGMKGKQLSFKVTDAQGVEIAKGTRTIDGLDGFDISFRLPPDVNLGSARVSMRLPKQRGRSWRDKSHYIKVQEFRRPEFQVKTTIPSGDHLVGTKTTATVRASYYTGGALADADVQWRVSASPGYYAPPTQSAFYFGIEEPWWRFHRRWHRHSPPAASFKAKTDSRGQHTLALDFQGVKQPRTMVVRAEASVSDVNRQRWTGGARILVHPASLYVGVRLRSRFLEPGTLDVESIVSNIAGKPAAGREVQITATPLNRPPSTPPSTCTTTSATASTRCKVNVQLPGLHRISASVVDDRKRTHKAEVYVWVSGGKLPGERNLSADRVVLTPDKKQYLPGDTARILVRAPFSPAEGLATISRNGVLTRQRFRVTKGTATIDVPLSMTHAPRTFVDVTLVGSADRVKPDPKARRKVPRRPAHAQGHLSLDVKPTERILAVDVKPGAPKLEPGAKTSVRVQVRDATGRPVPNAEVALVAVDESVLALSRYRIADPIKGVFYSPHNHASGVQRDELRRWVVAKTAKQLRTELDRKKSSPKPAPPMAEAGLGVRSFASGSRGRGPGGAKQGQIAVRQNFSPVAAFAPAVKTDASGTATVDMTLPDNLTRYRVTAVVAAGKNHFGQGESSITARRELMIRPSAPRFLSYGDRFELPVVVQNLSTRPLDVQVAVRASNLRLTDTWGWALKVPAGKRVEVRFPAATRSAGTARLQIVGAAPAAGLGDAAQLSVPVWTPATSEAFAVYGHLDGGGLAQPVAPPKDVIDSIGGLQVTLSSTALHSLQDAVDYLMTYPYDGTEQIASRVLAMSALSDLLPLFARKDGPSPAQMKKRVQRDIRVLAARQYYDGGFRLWSSHSHSHPYVSVHVTHALMRAKAKGFAVPVRTLERARRYLRDVRNRLPAYYGETAKHAIDAYAMHTLALSSDKTTRSNAIRRARSLAAKPGPRKASLEATGWLMATLASVPDAKSLIDAMYRHLGNRVTETAKGATFAAHYAEGAHLVMHSERRTDAILLDALVRARPKSDLVTKVVNGIMARRVKGRWLSSQENAFVLLGLASYFNTFESTPPDLVAAVWLGNRYGGAQAFKGRTRGKHRLDVSMREVLRGGANQDLVVEHKGTGRLYYRLGMSYAPKNLDLAPASHGFTVSRRYEALDDPSHVKRDKDGTWRIRAGARVRVVVSMVAHARRYNMVLVDGLPAGFETQNPALATTGRLGRGARTSSGWRWWSRWFDHQNLRDERAEAFSSDLRAGAYTYSYIALATTPGAFTAPPAKAEELYSPETFGRSATARVIIE